LNFQWSKFNTPADLGARRRRLESNSLPVRRLAHTMSANKKTTLANNAHYLNIFKVIRVDRIVKLNAIGIHYQRITNKQVLHQSEKGNAMNMRTHIHQSIQQNNKLQCDETTIRRHQPHAIARKLPYSKVQR
jgi:hypothetical protein